MKSLSIKPQDLYPNRTCPSTLSGEHKWTRSVWEEKRHCYYCQIVDDTYVLTETEKDSLRDYNYEMKRDSEEQIRIWDRQIEEFKRSWW